MTPSTRRWILAVFFIVAALGFLVPFWPLCLLGIALMALWGRWLPAIITGLLLDLAWGAPVGLLHFLYFPFTICAAALALARFVGAKYVLDRDVPETL